MKLNPRLDLFKIQLKSKDKSFKTFHDFVLDEIDSEAEIKDNMMILSNHIFDLLGTDIAKNQTSQKMLCIVHNKRINKHIDKIPTYSSKNNILSGIINGGPFGRDGILQNLEDETDAEPLGRNKTVLTYYYIFLYLPHDDDTGLAMIHSNRAEENITAVFKDFIRKCFKGEKYYHGIVDTYCPERFQDDFKKSSTIQQLSFKDTVVENRHSKDPIKNQLYEYDIQIIARPKNKNIPAKNADKFLDILKDKFIQFTNSQKKVLSAFNEKEVTLKDGASNTRRTFEWNSRDNEFSPVIYLDTIINKKNADGSPDFTELEDYCRKLFKDDILKEIRSDKNVQRT